MDTKDLKTKIKEIVKLAAALKNKHTDDKSALVNYACIFSHSKKEYEDLVEVAQKVGTVVQETPTGLLFRIHPLSTVAGKLKLLKIRIQDATHPELGDADFTVPNFLDFKRKYLPLDGFKLIIRKYFEMVELANPGFDVRAYFSNPPLDEQLGIK